MWRISLGLLLIFLVALAGCGGGIEWFPDDNNAGVGIPTGFSFINQSCAIPGSTATSNEYVVAGLTGNAAISVLNGEYGIADSSGNYPAVWNTGSGTIANGAKVKVRHTAAGRTSTSQMITTTLTIGAVSATFSSNIGPYLTYSTCTL